MPHVVSNVSQSKSDVVAGADAQERASRLFWESSPDALILCDERGTILEANPYTGFLLEYRVGELIGKNLCDLERSSGGFPSVRRQISALPQSGQSNFDADFISMSGKVVSLNISAKRIVFSGQACIYCCARDISQRKQTERALTEEKRRFDLVTQSLGVGLCIISREYKILWANDVLKNSFGDLDGKTCFLTVNRRDTICPQCGVRVIFETNGDKAVHEQMAYDVDGHPVWSRIIATPLRNEQGEVYAVFEIMLSVTERKAMEEKIRASEELLQRQRWELDRKAIALQEVIDNIELQKKKQQHDFVAYLNKVAIPLVEKLKKKKNAENMNFSLLEQALSDMDHVVSSRPSAYLYKLSSREIEICTMIKRGFTSKEIAGHLNISVQTVDKHRQHIRRKLRLTGEYNLYSYLTA